MASLKSPSLTRQINSGSQEPESIHGDIMVPNLHLSTTPNQNANMLCWLPERKACCPDPTKMNGNIPTAVNTAGQKSSWGVFSEMVQT